MATQSSKQPDIDIDVERIEDRVRREADAAVQALHDVRDLHAETVRARAEFFAADEQRRKKLGAALATLDNWIDTKTAAALTLPPIGPVTAAKRTARTAQKKTTTKAAQPQQ